MPWRKSWVEENPEEWMPWNYLDTLAELTLVA
jgi:hypothetical protein